MPISKDDKILDKLYNTQQIVTVSNIYYDDNEYEITSDNYIMKPRDLCEALDEKGVIRHKLTTEDTDLMELALSYEKDFYYCNITYEQTIIHIYQRKEKETK